MEFAVQQPSDCLQESIALHLGKGSNMTLNLAARPVRWATGTACVGLATYVS